MEHHGSNLESAPNPRYFGYPKPQNRGRKTGTKTETREPENRGYPHRTRTAAKLKEGTAGTETELAVSTSMDGDSG
jgi:hypothetical protein